MGRQYNTVEVRPSTTKTAPASPKAVTFAPAALVKLNAREPNNAEAWSLYHYEGHAARCIDCHNPLEGRRPCATGQAYARDVAEQVFRKDGEVYSRQKENDKFVRVRVPNEYTQLPQLLRLMERGGRPSSRPVVSYEPSPARRPAEPRSDRYEDTRTRVTLETASSEHRHRGSKHRSTKYAIVDAEDDQLEPTSSRPVQPPQDRRGSLYYDDMQHKQRREAYRVEVREPERKERRTGKERPQSGFWM